MNANSVHIVRKHLADYFTAIDYELDTLHEQNDGCAAQYKSRHCLLDISYTETEFGFKVIRSYHAPAHAKGQQDAAGGCIKRFADFAVLRREVIIQNAEKFCSFLKEKFSTPQSGSGSLRKRMFIYQEEVDFHRQAKKIADKNFRIRQIHCVRSVGKPGVVEVRPYTCYCPPCIEGRYDECDTEVGGPWKTVKLDEATDGEQIAEEEDDEDSTHLSQWVSEGSVVAVKNDDGYSLYELKSALETLETTEEDEEGNKLPAGVDVLRGNQLVLDKKIKLGTYYTVSESWCFIHPEDVLFLCTSAVEKKLRRGTFTYVRNTELDNIQGALE